MKRLLIVAACLGVAGCATKPDYKGMRDRRDTKVKTCKQQYHAGKGNYHNIALCEDIAYSDWGIEAGVDFDVIQKLNDTRDSVAQQLDSGTISTAEADLVLRKSMADARAQAVNANRERSRQAALIYLSHQPQQTSQPAPINCTSYKMGMFVNTNCR